MADLKNLRQTSTIKVYQDEFDTLLSKVNITESQAVSMFLGGMNTDFCLRGGNVSSSNNKPLLTLPATKQTFNPGRKQLNKKEYEGKRAKNQCFYCDQKYVSGHKCSEQMFVLEVLTTPDGEEEEFTREEGLEECLGNNQQLQTEIQGLLEEFNDVFGIPKCLHLNRSQNHRITLKEGVTTDKFPIPVIEELIDELHGSKVFPKLDLRKFIHGYASITQPLTTLLKKNAFNWNNQATESFHALQQAMVKSPVLALPNFDKELIIKTDALGYGVGVVLQQEGHPIAFLSKTLAPKHQSLAAYEKELLAVVLALQKWIRYLFRIDHFSLKYMLVEAIKATWSSDSALKSVITSLQQGNSKNSRYTWSANELRRKGKLVVGNVLKNSGLVEAIKATWSSDSALKSVITSLQQGNSKNSRYNWSANELRRKGNLVVGNDEQLRLKLISHLHDSPTGGHSGVWQDISMEFIETLPLSHNKSVIFVMMDRLRKYAHFIPLIHPFTASHVAQAFLDNVYKLHGLPSIIVSDRDKSAGQTKTVNKYVETYLRCMTELVDRTLQAREQVIAMLKFHLKAAQDRMKIYADKKRSDRSLQWLKKCHSTDMSMGSLPLCDSEGSLAVIPYKILDRKLEKKGNRAVVYGLIQWSNRTVEDSTWELLTHIEKRFPEFNINP
ncbi:retrotransposon-related protein [Tanacetum coccineum]